VRGKTSEPFRDFFGGMREHWRKSTLIVLIDVGIGGLIALDLSIVDTMDVPEIPAMCTRSVSFLGILALLLANLYIWPLLVTFDLTIRQLIKVSLRLAFLRPLWSIFATTLALLPLLLALVVPRFIVILLTFSSCALLASWGAWHVIEPYQHELNE
jgi:uncharacterized membrane protein YesL